VWILALVAFIDSVDRGILPGVLTKVQDDLHFSDTRAGVLGTAFILSGFLVVLPAGYLADRYRRTRIIAFVLAAWGAISAVNALVRNYWQFLGVRATLGIGETVDNPASQSLMADYYAPEVRARAYAVQRLAPTVGTAVGTALAGGVAALLGWRWAFLIVGIPGSLLAVAVWRLPEPARGESDRPAPGPEAAAPSPVVPVRARGAGALMADVRRCLRVRSLRALMVGTAIAQGALAGTAFWSAAFYERHTTLGSGGGAGIAGVLILFGALGGTYFGGVMADRMRGTVEGGPMLLAGCTAFTGAALLMTTFLPVPLWYRMPAQLVSVALVVAGFPALTAMTSEVVPAVVRGTAFSLVGFLGAVAGALSPLLIGVLADQFPITVDGETKGHLANAFLCVTPLVMLGALVVIRGRRYVAEDARAAAIDNTLLSGSTRLGDG
jgi:MFS family permease